MPTVPNSGIVLWLQQFVAMFMKRFRHSLRFWAAVVSQFVLPLIFVFLALVLAKTLPVPGNDGSRELRIDNSALSSTINVFYADFTDGSSEVPVDFEVSDNSFSRHSFDNVIIVDAIITAT